MNKESRVRRSFKSWRLFALCALLCVPLIGIVPLRDTAYRVVYRAVPSLQQRINIELLKATQSNDLPKVKQLVARGADVNFKDVSGVTALESALLIGIKSGETRLAMAQFLVQNGADPNANTSNQGSLFFWVAEYSIPDERDSSYPDYAKLMQLMLNTGITPTEKHSSSDILYQAARFGTAKNVRKLLSQGADVNAPLRTHGSGPSTTLLAAVHELRPDIVRFLLEHGANPNAVGSIYDTSAIEPPLLHLLTEMNYSAPLSQKGLSIARLLLQHGANVNAFTSSVNPKTFQVIQNHTDQGWTALMYVAGAGAGDLQTVKLLLQHGANPNLQDKSGKTALDYARGEKKTAVIEVLENTMRTRK